VSPPALLGARKRLIEEVNLSLAFPEHASKYVEIASNSKPNVNITDFRSSSIPSIGRSAEAGIVKPAPATHYPPIALLGTHRVHAERPDYVIVGMPVKTPFIDIPMDVE
jgi:hypothetical protein